MRFVRLLLLLLSTTLNCSHAEPLHARRAPQLSSYNQAKGKLSHQSSDKPKTQLRCPVTIDGSAGDTVMFDLRQAHNRGSLHAIKPVGPLPCAGYTTDRSFYVRARTSDFLVLQQIMDQHEFAPLDELLSSSSSSSSSGSGSGSSRGPKTILDLGSNVGFASAYFAARWPAAQIAAVEPSKMNHAMTVLNNINNTNVRPFWGGVWPVPGMLRISSTLTRKGLGFAEWGFVVEELNQHSLPDSPADQVIPAYTIDQLIAIMGWSSVDYVKVDIECGEYHLLGVGNATQSPKLPDDSDEGDDNGSISAAAAPPAAAAVEPPAWLKKVGCLTMELHDWCGKDPAAVKAVLEAAGLQFHGQAGELLIYCRQPSPVTTSAAAAAGPAAAAAEPQGQGQGQQQPQGQPIPPRR